MRQQHVLVLDDNEAILAVVKEALIYEDFQVNDIPDAVHFFEAVRDFRPDLILLDYHLSGVNGGDLCRQIKAMEQYRHIPVIIFSAYFSKGDPPIGVDCDGFLHKPFDLTELLEVISQHTQAARPGVGIIVPKDLL